MPEASIEPRKGRDSVIHRIWAEALTQIAMAFAMVWFLRGCMGK